MPVNQFSPLRRASGRLTFRAADRASQAIGRVLDLDEDVAGRIFTRFDAGRIVAEAEALDRDPARLAGPLAGLLVAIKDLFDEEGEVTTAGSVHFAGNTPATRDAVAVARLRAAGAIGCGRTNMSEFAYSGVGLNPHYGTPPNSHDPERIPGGSTSGGAIAVAFGIADFALGSDTGGSVRIPAAFNALAGFKPTQAAVPLDGASPLSGTYDSVGPLALDIATCAAVHAVLSGEDRPAPSIGDKPLRLGVMRTLLTDDMDKQVKADFDAALKALRDEGIELVDVKLAEIAQAGAVNRILVASEAHAIHRGYLDALETAGDPRVLKRIRAAESFGSGEADAARQTRAEAIVAFADLADGFDAIIAPTVPIVPPLIEEVEDDFDRLNALVLRNPSTINFLDGCAATVPMHRSGELPTGLMIFAPGGRDWHVLDMAEEVEAIVGDR